MYILGITPGDGFDLERWDRVLESGIDGLMIREKQMETRALLQVVRWVQERAHPMEVWVNGRLDVALVAQVAQVAWGGGLHAPETYPLIPDGLLPLSRPIHTESQFTSRLHCRQLLVGPIFAVPDKGEAWGIERLHQALNHLPEGPRILALGGIGPERVIALRHPRLDGIALIRALWDSARPSQVVKALRDAWV